MCKVSIRRRFVQIVAVAAIASTSIFASATGASALSAGTYGFECNSQHHWVRQNWPIITTDTATNVNVWMKTTLYKATSTGWKAQRSSQWYNGVSNNTGRKVIGYFWTPYYWVYYSNGSRVAPQLGHVFSHLSPGRYRTVETFQVGTRRWTSSRHEFVRGTRTVTSCRA